MKIVDFGFTVVKIEVGKPEHKKTMHNFSALAVNVSTKAVIDVSQNSAAFN
ncbi:hypothetical protein [Paenibacillus taihuensis]|uniref:hypothetical protein n=1 Tax=Paenibacillus taihuensis TaxID=1156355 RepID=UPI0015F29F9A|nr:hypothetical protein [Paenibacillus taihuensis]